MQSSPQFNETETISNETEKVQQIAATRLWNEVIQTSPSNTQADPMSSSKKSADEVEEELEAQ